MPYLVFALPQSPMSQPWAVIAGNTLSALVGILLIHLVDQPLLAMPLAASLSILRMFLITLLASASSGCCHDCGLRSHHALPLCFFPGHGRFDIASYGWGGLQ